MILILSDTKQEAVFISYHVRFLNRNLVLMIMYMMSQCNFTHNVTRAGPKVTNTTHALSYGYGVRLYSTLTLLENELMGRRAPLAHCSCHSYPLME